MHKRKFTTRLVEKQQTTIVKGPWGQSPPHGSDRKEVTAVRKTAKTLTITMLTAVICLSGYNLWRISDQYTKEERVKGEMTKYRPAALTVAAAAEPAKEFIAAMPEPMVNQQIIDMQTEVNSDIVGWLTIPDTRIDYPFVIAEDNNYYLRRDLYKKQAPAGTLFMDYRCGKSFQDFNTIIYGHNMKNGSMFGDLKLFADEWFFAANTWATISLWNNTYTAEIFAYMIVRADDKIIFGLTAEKGEYLDYIKKNARHYREPDTEKKILTMATCSYEFNGARIILLANINS